MLQVLGAACRIGAGDQGRCAGLPLRPAV